MSEKYYQEYGPMRRRRVEDRSPFDEPPPEEPQPPEEPPPRQPRRARRRLPIAGILFALFAAALVIVLPYASDLIAADRAANGVTIQGMPVAGMNRVQIRAALDQRYSEFLDTPLRISYENRVWSPKLADLGARLDLDQLADAALIAGHRGNLLQRFEEQRSIWEGGLDLGPQISVDTSVLQTYLSSIASDLEQPPRDAALSITAGKVLPTPALPGRQALVDATVIDVLRAIETLEPQTVVLRTRILEPVIGNTGIAQAVDDARNLLKTSLTLKQGARTWIWDEERLASLLTLRIAEGRMVVGIDYDRLARAVEKLAQVVDSPSGEPAVSFRDGRLQIVKEGQIGLRLKQLEATETISAALMLSKHEITLPVEDVSPQVTARTLPSLGIVELVSEGKSSFAGSAPYRITNIKAGALRMNGVLIPPGAEFSFNTQLGAVDEANGFVQGYAVIGNRTQLEWGGGVCQVSTTVYRSAFWAGMPITERHAHPFYISWYDAFSFPDKAGPGMDATIFTGVQDLRFANDTGHWLLMETEIDEANQVLTVRLYGTLPNRLVDIVGPEIDNVIPPPAAAVYVDDPKLPAGTVKQTDRARKGMDIVVYRVITEGGVKKVPETFFTRFKSWPDVFVRGTGQ